MLFNSYGFIFVFLPAVLLFFSVALRWRKWLMAIVWLVSASLFFYGYWNPQYILLILTSMLGNYLLASLMTRLSKKNIPQEYTKLFLVAGVSVNLFVLAYYKYQGFVFENINSSFGLSLDIPDIVLPLAISFFTFQQIAYLVDVYREKISGDNTFLKYCLFVTFFPQLIAGPIVHYQDLVPQFSFRNNIRINTESLAIGISIFSVGLFKKFLADAVSVYGNPVFALAANGETPSFFEAWYGAVAYTMQLYFDFSGYSDMAVGIGNMFGIRLPLNFFSPYKAVSVIDFWRRWHMTLSKFLRDYLYIPLGGSRQGTVRKYINLLITMLLGGLWHGAGWTFILWGGLHGICLVINHAWRSLWQRLEYANVMERSWVQLFGRVLTFIIVVISWVLFRADNLNAASTMLQSMVDTRGFLPNPSIQSIPYLDPFSPNHIISIPSVCLLVTLLIVVWVLPNTQQIFEKYNPTTLTYEIQFQETALYSCLKWHPSLAWLITILTMNLASLSALASISSEFLYFQF